MSARATASTEELLLAIGGVVVHLDLKGAHPTFIEQVRQRYGAFEMPPAAWV